MLFRSNPAFRHSSPAPQPPNPPPHFAFSHSSPAPQPPNHPPNPAFRHSSPALQPLNPPPNLAFRHSSPAPQPPDGTGGSVAGDDSSHGSETQDVNTRFTSRDKGKGRRIYSDDEGGPSGVGEEPGRGSIPQQQEPRPVSSIVLRLPSYSNFFPARVPDWKPHSSWCGTRP